MSALLPVICNSDSTVRLMGARAIAGGLQTHQSTAETVITALTSAFEKASTGASLTSTTSWITRHGVVSTLGAAASRKVTACSVFVCHLLVFQSSVHCFGLQALPVRSVESILCFLIAQALCDKNGEVSVAALSAGRELMQQYGEELLAPLLAQLEVRASAYSCL